MLHHRGRTLSLLSAAALVGAGAVVFASPAHAATIPVTDEATLAAALTAAIDGDIIQIAAGTITLTADLPSVNASISVQGAGSSGTTIEADGFETFSFGFGGTVASTSISGLTIENSANDGVTANTTSFVANDLVINNSGDNAIDVYGSTGAVSLSNIVIDTSNATGIYFNGNSGAAVTLQSVSVVNAGDDSVEVYGEPTSLTVTDLTTVGGSDGLYVDTIDTTTTVSGFSATGVSADALDFNNEGGSVVVDSATITGSGDNGVEADFEGGTATLTNVTIADSDSDGVDLGLEDGAVFTATNVISTGASDRGFFIEAAGDSSATLTEVTATGSGTGAHFAAVTGSTITAHRSTFADSTDSGLKLIPAEGSAVYVTASTSSGNSDGVLLSGDIGELGEIGDVGTISGTVSIVNSTISGNSDAGIRSEEGSDDIQTSVESTTIANNLRAFALGINPLELSNSIVAGLDAGDLGDNAAISTTLVQSVTPAIQTILDAGTGNRTGDPLLSALANNGGPTLTHLPAQGSPVINAGGSTSLTVDQRGSTRVVGGRLDLGSVELQAADTPAAALPSTGVNTAGLLGAAALVMAAGLALALRRRHA